MLQVYSLMFTYNKTIEGTDTGVRGALCRRLGKHKYAVRAMLRCKDMIIKPEALDIICKNVERRARRCEVKKSSMYDLKETRTNSAQGARCPSSEAQGEVR